MGKEDKRDFSPEEIEAGFNKVIPDKQVQKVAKELMSSGQLTFCYRPGEHIRFEMKDNSSEGDRLPGCIIIYPDTLISLVSQALEKQRSQVAIRSKTRYEVDYEHATWELGWEEHLGRWHWREDNVSIDLSSDTPQISSSFTQFGKGEWSYN
jgi:hypothetical protein